MSVFGVASRGSVGDQERGRNTKVVARLLLKIIKLVADNGSQWV